MASPQTKPSLLFTCTFWGYSHTKLFIDILLPSLLTPGNLPRIAQDIDLSFSIMTTSGNLAEIEARPALAVLKKYAKVQIGIEIDLSADRKFEIHHRHWRDAIEQAKHDGSFLCLLPPDICISDGSLEAIAKRILAGAAAIYVSGIRVATETFVPEVMTKYFADNGAPTPISHRDLVELTLRHSHPFNNSLYIDSPKMPYIAEMMLTPVPGVGWVKHCYVAGPIVFVDVQRAGLSRIQIVTSVDKRDDFHTIYDSHEFGLVSVSPLHLYGDWFLGMDQEDLIMQAYKYNTAYRSVSADLVSRENFKIYANANDLQREAWSQAQGRIDDRAADVKSAARLASLGMRIRDAGLQRAGKLAILAAFAEPPCLRLDRDKRYICLMPEDEFLPAGTVGCTADWKGMEGIGNFLRRHIFSSLLPNEGIAINLANEKVPIHCEGATITIGSIQGALRGGDGNTIVYGMNGCLSAPF